MPAYNKVVLMGNLCRDWELRYSKDGTPIGSNSLAINRAWKDEDGEKKEEVTFVDLTLFGKSAETAAEYQKKGSLTHIEGRLRQEKWEDKETEQPRSKLSVVVERFVLMGDAKSSDDDNDDRPPKKHKADPDDDDKPRKQRKHDYSPDDDDKPAKKHSKHPF